MYAFIDIPISSGPISANYFYTAGSVSAGSSSAGTAKFLTISSLASISAGTSISGGIGSLFTSLSSDGILSAGKIYTTGTVSGGAICGNSFYAQGTVSAGNISGNVGQFVSLSAFTVSSGTGTFVKISFTDGTTLTSNLVQSGIFLSNPSTAGVTATFVKSYASNVDTNGDYSLQVRCYLTGTSSNFVFCSALKYPTKAVFYPGSTGTYIEWTANPFTQ